MVDYYSIYNYSKLACVKASQKAICISLYVLCIVAICISLYVLCIVIIIIFAFMNTADMHAGHSESESSSPSYLTDSESSHIEAGASALEANDDLILTKKKNKGHLHRQRSVPTPSSSSSETTHSSNEVDCDIISTPETFPNPQMYDDSSPQPLVAPYGHRYRKHKPTPRNSMTTSSSTNVSNLVKSFLEYIYMT